MLCYFAYVRKCVYRNKHVIACIHTSEEGGKKKKKKKKEKEKTTHTEFTDTDFNICEYN